MTDQTARVLPLPAATGRHLAGLLRALPDDFSHLYENLSGAPAMVSGRGDRWSILFARPSAELRLLADGQLQRRGFQPARAELAESADFLSAFDDWVANTSRSRTSLRTPDRQTELPFTGGWSFYLAYELAGQIEPSLDLPPFDPGETKTRNAFPTAIAQYHPAAVLFDALHQQAWLVHDGEQRAQAGELQARIEQQLARESMADPLAPLTIDRLMVDPPARYTDGVRRIHDYLLAGDVFQANLSRGWHFTAQGDGTPEGVGAAIYQRLARHNPAPFAAWYRLAEGQIISSSPERLVAHEHGRVSTRPIAGTRRRDPDPERDQALIDELRAHPKERAEHVMLIDLERNDLGRVCQPGSIAVDELMVVESFAHVHHLVSNVSGRLRPDRSIGDLLAAVFPGGTITGCPKVRCMEILSELERTGRGPYTGSLGYLSLDGRLDSNILIRTVFLDAAGRGTFRTGAGIVVDSEPERERIETEEKARGLLLALGQDVDAVPGA